MVGTFWAFVPIIIAIIIALVTKRIYFAIFIGAFLGCLFYCNFNPINALGIFFKIVAEKVGSGATILIFIIILGIIVVLIQKTGGSIAYGEWANKKVKSKNAALISTSFLGCLIFIDDYFNCLTVGNVMKHVTDKHKISRAKLAWIIDSTAAPVCILAPISSWAAAVGAAVNQNGIATFLKTIPFNFYALFTLAVIFTFTALNIDFPLMKKFEEQALNSRDESIDIHTNNNVTKEENSKSKIAYLIVPVIVLIICCVGTMIYTGYFTNPETGLLENKIFADSLIDAFNKCNTGLSLAIGSVISLFIIVIYYVLEKAIKIKTLTEAIIEGFKIMIPAIMILVLGWTLTSIVGSNGEYLNAKLFIENTLNGINFDWLFPALFFALASAISFSSGNSWGTFGILIPIALAIISDVNSSILILTISATLGGAVFGDHISPISDTTILSSTGAGCNHLDHVKTQIPYALFAAILTFILYLISGILSKLNLLTLALILLPIGAVLFIFGLIILRKKLN